jgi:hypothetical protein
MGVFWRVLWLPQQQRRARDVCVVDRESSGGDERHRDQAVVGKLAAGRDSGPTDRWQHVDLSVPLRRRLELIMDDPLKPPFRPRRESIERFLARHSITIPQNGRKIDCRGLTCNVQIGLTKNEARGRIAGKEPIGESEEWPTLSPTHSRDPAAPLRSSALGFELY